MTFQFSEAIVYVNSSYSNRFRYLQTAEHGGVRMPPWPSWRTNLLRGDRALPWLQQMKHVLLTSKQNKKHLRTLTMSILTPKKQKRAKYILFH